MILYILMYILVVLFVNFQFSAIIALCWPRFVCCELHSPQDLPIYNDFLVNSLVFLYFKCYTEKLSQIPFLKFLFLNFLNSPRAWILIHNESEINHIESEKLVLSYLSILFHFRILPYIFFYILNFCTDIYVKLKSLVDSWQMIFEPYRIRKTRSKNW